MVEFNPGDGRSPGKPQPPAPPLPRPPHSSSASVLHPYVAVRSVLPVPAFISIAQEEQPLPAFGPFGDPITRVSEEGAEGIGNNGRQVQFEENSAPLGFGSSEQGSARGILDSGLQQVENYGGLRPAGAGEMEGNGNVMGDLCAHSAVDMVWSGYSELENQIMAMLDTEDVDCEGSMQDIGSLDGHLEGPDNAFNFQASDTRNLEAFLNSNSSSGLPDPMNELERQLNSGIDSQMVAYSGENAAINTERLCILNASMEAASPFWESNLSSPNNYLLSASNASIGIPGHSDDMGGCGETGAQYLAEMSLHKEKKLAREKRQAALASDTPDITLQSSVELEDVGVVVPGVEEIQAMLDRHQTMVHYQIEELQKVVSLQRDLTGLNPLSQEMASAALGTKAGKRADDLLTPEALSFLRDIFAIKDSITKKEAHDLSVRSGATCSQVKAFFVAQQNRLRKLLQQSLEAGKRETSNKVQKVHVSDEELAAIKALMTSKTITLDSFEKLLELMRSENTFLGQSQLLQIIQQIENGSVLRTLVQKGGLKVIVKWLVDASLEEQTTLIRLLLKALSRLPINHAVPAHISSVVQTVNKLRFYGVTDVVNRARSLLSRWSKLLGGSDMRKTQTLESSKAPAKTSQLPLKHMRESDAIQRFNTAMKKLKTGTGHSGGEVKQSTFLNAPLAPVKDDLKSGSGEKASPSLLSPRPLESVKKTNASQLAESSLQAPKKRLASEQNKERRKVLLVEELNTIGRRGKDIDARRSSTVEKASRPLSADDIQKAKMRARLLQNYKSGSTQSPANHTRELGLSVGTSKGISKQESSKSLDKHQPVDNTRDKGAGPSVLPVVSSFTKTVSPSFDKHGQETSETKDFTFCKEKSSLKGHDQGQALASCNLNKVDDKLTGTKTNDAEPIEAERMPVLAGSGNVDDIHSGHSVSPNSTLVHEKQIASAADTHGFENVEEGKFLPQNLGLSARSMAKLTETMTMDVTYRPGNVQQHSVSEIPCSPIREGFPENDVLGEKDVMTSEENFSSIDDQITGTPSGTQVQQLLDATVNVAHNREKPKFFSSPQELDNPYSEDEVTVVASSKNNILLHMVSEASLPSSVEEKSSGVEAGPHGIEQFNSVLTDMGEKGSAKAVDEGTELAASEGEITSLTTTSSETVAVDGSGPLVVVYDVSKPSLQTIAIPDNEIELSIFDIDLSSPTARHALLSEMYKSAIPWNVPPEVHVDPRWSVAMGEESKEKEIQSSRVKREEEAYYPDIDTIPLNPKDTWDEEADYDDSLTLGIPLEAIVGDEKEVTESKEAGSNASLDVSGQAGDLSNLHAGDDFNALTGSLTKLLAKRVGLEKSPGSAALSLADLQAQNKNLFSNHDPELLALLLNNPALVTELTSSQGTTHQGIHQKVPVLEQSKTLDGRSDASIEKRHEMLKANPNSSQSQVISQHVAFPNTQSERELVNQQSTQSSVAHHSKTEMSFSGQQNLPYTAAQQNVQTFRTSIAGDFTGQHNLTSVHSVPPQQAPRSAGNATYVTHDSNRLAESAGVAHWNSPATFSYSGSRASEAPRAPRWADMMHKGQGPEQLPRSQNPSGSMVRPGFPGHMPHVAGNIIQNQQEMSDRAFSMAGAPRPVISQDILTSSKQGSGFGIGNNWTSNSNLVAQARDLSLRSMPLANILGNGPVWIPNNRLAHNIPQGNIPVLPYGNVPQHGVDMSLRPMLQNPADIRFARDLRPQYHAPWLNSIPPRPGWRGP